MKLTEEEVHFNTWLDQYIVESGHAWGTGRYVKTTNGEVFNLSTDEYRTWYDTKLTEYNQRELNVDNIDVMKCLGCKKGISLFTEDNGQYWHTDLFATPEAGESYKCENSDIIGKFLRKNGMMGTLLPNEHSKAFFDTQEMWWEDIITLAFDTMQDKKLVNTFLNEGEPGNRVWNLPNIEIERKLLAIAFDNGTDVNAEDYPDLIKWKTESE